MNKYMRFVKYGLAAGAVVLSLSGLAQAATCSTASVTTSTACQVGSDNNDSAAELNAGSGFFGNKDWILADKSDSAPLISGMTLNFTGANLKVGNWSVSSFASYTKAILVVKGGAEGWVAYLLDLTKLSGTWSTADILNGGGKQPDMSHLSLYVADLDENLNVVTPVPVPASALLLLGAMGALTALRRWRKA